jgi:integrase/recombinase XerC
VRAQQQALGHDSVATTQRYTAVSGREIRAVSEAAAWRAEPIDQLDQLAP